MALEGFLNWFDGIRWGGRDKANGGNAVGQIADVIGPEISLDEIVNELNLHEWQTPPFMSIIEQEPGLVIQAIEWRVQSSLGGVHVERFRPEDFEGLPSQYYGTNRAEIMADVFNDNADVLEQLFEPLVIQELVGLVMGQSGLANAAWDASGENISDDSGWCW